MLFAQSIDQEMMMRQRLFGQIAGPQPGGLSGAGLAPFSGGALPQLQPTKPGLQQQQQSLGTGMDMLMVELSRQQGLHQLVAPRGTPQQLAGGGGGLPPFAPGIATMFGLAQHSAPPPPQQPAAAANAATNSRT